MLALFHFSGLPTFSLIWSIKSTKKPTKSLKHDQNCWSENVNILIYVWLWSIRIFITLSLQLISIIDLTRNSNCARRYHSNGEFTYLIIDTNKGGTIWSFFNEFSVAILKKLRNRLDKKFKKKNSKFYWPD